MSAGNLRLARRALAVTGTLAVAVLAAAPGFAADSGSSDGVTVVNTETVQVYLNASGDVESKRVYEQLALSGHGSVDLKNPVSTSGLRNLDGFSGFKVVNGEQVAKTSVDGEKRYRSVSDYKGTLPVSVKPTYKLDGKKVAAGDVVGESGKLEVSFEIENRTSKPQEVSFPDGNGGTITKTVDVPVPMVGSLTTTTPKTFTNIDPGGANTAGDGTGGQTLSYNLVLFPPLGSTTTTVGYSADITDGVVPRVEVAMLPVDPLASPTFKVATEGYQGGAATGAQLVEGATTIDGNLLKLRDGAADLLAGLIQLRDGADQLHSGLAGDAAPGAKKLAAGAEELSDGLVRLRGGAGDLSAGAGKLDRGAKQLKDGADQLNGGINQLKAGVSALPASVSQQVQANPDYQKLLGALSAMVSGIGTPNDMTPNTLLGGLNLIRAGLRSPLGVDGCDQTAAPGTATACGVADGAEIIAGKVGDGITSINTALFPAAMGAYSALVTLAACPAPVGGLPPLAALADNTSPCYAAAVSALGYGAPAGLPAPFADGGLKVQLQTAQGKLTEMYQGVDGGILPGITGIKKGLHNAPCDPNQTDKTAANFCGISQALQAIQAGVPALVQGLATSISQTLLQGVNQLSDGSAQLAAGAGDLAGGTGQLSDGAEKLSAGAGDASDGGGQLADGAGTLADGLGDAADGSGQIADGLKTAAGGAPQLVDGAGRLSTEGMGQLKSAGKDTAANYGELYAVISAGAERAQTESMAFGAPAGAEGLTAYSFVIRGDDGEGDRNVERALAAAVLLGLGSGALALRRRLV